MASSSHTDLWALQIEEMDPLERANCCEFGPYLVTPKGRLCLPIEAIRRGERTEEWPRGQAPGWTRIRIDGATDERHWSALGSDFLFAESQSRSIPVHTVNRDARAGTTNNGGGLVRAVFQGKAFAFCNQLFLLPEETDFVLNSFRYHIRDMDPLSVFVGYRGQSQAYPEILSPGLFRTGNTLASKSSEDWGRQSRIVGNILKQRFLENENKALTDIEAAGIMQHHYLLGATDLLDLTFDINVAKWFALNEWQTRREYRKKQFVACTSEEEALCGASRIILIAVRSIGSMPIPKDVWDNLQIGIRSNLWDGYPEIETLSQFETLPSNLAPLWSEFPKRQRGFGLRGIGPMDSDPDGAVLAAWEYVYHPHHFPDGWDRFGGPTLTLDGRTFERGEDSAGLSEYLFPDPPDWLIATKKEVDWMLA